MQHILYNLYKVAWGVVLFGGLSACQSNNRSAQNSRVAEDVSAKKMLQGIWLNDDEEEPAFRVVGDTIFYPDSTSQPVYFQIIHDTLMLHSANLAKYIIVKQAPHLFVFKNQNGDVVRCIKTTDKSYLSYFEASRPQALNQGKLIKKDSIVIYGKDHYHWYIQVNPTSYKVAKPTYNDDGVEVDNIYYDNIVHLSLFRGAEKLYSRDFRKHDFSQHIPASVLNQSILSDIVYSGATPKGFHFAANVSVPDSPTSYILNVVIDFQGKASY